MKRLLFAALLLCAPATSRAQAEYKFADFLNTSDGFTTTLLFRNTNAYSDARVIGLRRLIVIGSKEMQQACAIAPVVDCYIGGTMAHAVGPLQTGTFLTGPNNLYEYNGPFGEDSCAAMCLYRAFYPTVGSMFGCNLPGPVNPPMLTGFAYAGRSCDADGFTGYWGIDLRFTMSFGGQVPIAPPPFDVGDLSVRFEEVDFGANTNVVPEPSTWAMLGFGIVCVALVRRKRHT